MSVYRIAGLNISVDLQNERTIEYFADYLVPDCDPDIAVIVTEEMLQYEREHAETPCSEWVNESVAILRVICDRIVHDYDGFFLHCSCLEIDGGAVVFTAPPGTGKSTHARMWREHFGDRVTMINDDKPLVRRTGDDFIIYGTPWNGKHSISTNTSAPIRAVFFLEQAKENCTEPLDAVSALTLLLRQTVIPSDKADLSLLLDMLSALIERVPMFRLKCNISHEAAQIAYDAIKNK